MQDLFAMYQSPFFGIEKMEINKHKGFLKFIYFLIEG